MEKLSKKTNVFKRAFSRYKRRRFGFYSNIRNDTISVKCDAYDTILTASSVSTLAFQDTTVSYYPFASILQNSSSWNNYYSTYSHYMIYGIKITSYPTADIAFLRQLFGRACPTICVAIVPNYSGTNVGDYPKINDNNFMFTPGSVDLHSKYWSFPPGFQNGTVQGLGVWNLTNAVSGQGAQVSICQSESGNNASSPHNIAGLRMTLYVKFKTRLT